MNGKPLNRFGFIPKDHHSDMRGWVINPFDHLDPPGSVADCHAFSIEPGCRRGNHFHPGRDEQVVVLHGEIVIRDLETGHEEVMSPGRPGLMAIPPGVPHVFENRSGEVAVALCFSSGERDATMPDTVRV